MTKPKVSCLFSSSRLTVFYAKPNPELQESTQSEAIVDPLEGEQTWPTDEEIAEAEEQRRKATSQETLVKVVKKVPKGTSEYQAAWIMDEAGKDDAGEDPEDEDGEEEDEDEDAEDMTDDEGGMLAAKEDASDDDIEDEGVSEIGDDDDEYEEISVGTDKDANYDEGMDEDEDKTNLEKMRKDRKAQVRCKSECDFQKREPERIKKTRSREH